MNVYERIRQCGIIPVIKLNEPEKAVQLGKALLEGGISVAEITFRAFGAERAIRLMKEKLPDMLVGAGTVLTVGQADRAIEAGADFIVAPGLNKEIVKYVREKGVVMIPGCLTPSEIEQALDLGINIVKFFPAEQAGGLSMIKALSGPYSDIQFLPTGGINEANLAQYLDNPKVMACGGSWMVKETLLEKQDYKSITTLCKAAVSEKEKVRK